MIGYFEPLGARGALLSYRRNSLVVKIKHKSNILELWDRILTTITTTLEDWLHHQLPRQENQGPQDMKQALTRLGEDPGLSDSGPRALIIHVGGAKGSQREQRWVPGLTQTLLLIVCCQCHGSGGHRMGVREVASHVPTE